MKTWNIFSFSLYINHFAKIQLTSISCYPFMAILVVKFPREGSQIFALFDYSAHDLKWLLIPALFCQYLWQLTRLAWKHNKVNATYMLVFVLEGIKITYINNIAWINLGPLYIPYVRHDNPLLIWNRSWL